MTSEFGTRPAELVAGISPSIGSCHYPVGRNVIDAFEGEFEPDELEAFLKKSTEDEGLLDLWTCNERQLEQAGVRNENIETAGICTVCQNDLFYSYRGENGQTGRFAGIITLHSSTARAYG